MREAFKGATSNSQYLVLRNSTTGVGLTGKVFSDVTGSYTRNRAARTAITMATLASASAAFSSGGFIEVDATNCPGLYRFDIPDAAFATGVDKVLVSVKVTGAIEEHIEFLLIDWNKQVASIPNAAAEAAGGLFTRGTGAGQINQAANGMIDTNPVRLNNVAQSLLDLKDFADDGYDPATNKVQGVVLVDALTTYTGNTPQTGDAFARLGAPVGASISADVALVQADTDNIQTRIPAALVSGRIDASVGAMAAGTITATAVATNAFDADALANDAVIEIAGAVWEELRASHVTADTFGAGVKIADPYSDVMHMGTAQAGAASSITLATGASATNDLYKGLQVKIYGGTGAGQARVITGYTGATKVATLSRTWATTPDSTSLYAIGDDDSVQISSGLSATATLGTGGITAATFAAGAINSAALDATAAVEIAGAVWDEAIASHLTAGSTGETLNNVQADTDNIQTRLPAALVSGRIDASVGAMAANSLTATAINADAFTAAKFAADVTTELQAGLATAADLATVQADTDDIQSRLPAALVSGRMNASVGAMAADTLTASAIATDALGSLELGATAVAEIADAVWDEAIAGHLTAGSTGAALNGAGSAGDPWTTALPGAYGAGTAGAIVGVNLDAAVTSRLAPTTPGNTLDVAATGEAGLDFSNLELPASPTTLTNIRVPNVTLADTLTTYTGNTPQTGDNFARLGAPTGASIAADIAAVQLDTDNIQTRIPAALTGGRIDANVGAMEANTITAAAIATDALGSLELGTAAVAEIADAVWDELRTGHGTAGSFGEGVLVETLNPAARVQVNGEVLDTLTVDLYAEPASVPSSTCSIKDRIAWMFVLSRNEKRQTTSATTVRDAANSVDLATAASSDAAGVTTHGAWS